MRRGPRKTLLVALVILGIAVAVTFSTVVRGVGLVSAAPPSHSTSSHNPQRPHSDHDRANSTAATASSAAARNESGGVPPVLGRGNGSSGNSPALRIGGRDGADHSHLGMSPDEDGLFTAWAANDSGRCFGLAPRPECIEPGAVEWFARHVLLGIVSGKEGAFRVEVSQCSWLGHFPPENIFVFSDRVSRHPHTPHRWVSGHLPDAVEERNGDVYSPFLKKGYVREVRRAGQGYSAGWVVAQFRFPQAIDALLREAAGRSSSSDSSTVAGNHSSSLLPQSDIRWIMVVDDDTIVNLSNLVRRLRGLDERKPWYLSRRGWGGAGHVYSREAMQRMRRALPECVDKWMIRQFRASDTMLLKCAEHAKLTRQLEHTMSHCPASRAGVEKLLSREQVTFHGKKDFYPPILLTTFRTGLYYLASYCHDATAAELAVFYSACAFGNCKVNGCTKEKDARRAAVWARWSRNDTSTAIPWNQLSSIPKG